MNAEGDGRESRFWDLAFLKSDHKWTADNDTDEEEEDDSNPIGDICDLENMKREEPAVEADETTLMEE